MSITANENLTMKLSTQKLLKLGHIQLQSQSRVQVYTLACFFVSTLARHLHTSRTMMSPLKRKAEKNAASPSTKKAKLVLPEYHLATPRKDDLGKIVWPAREYQIERARAIIKEW